MENIIQQIPSQLTTLIAIGLALQGLIPLIMRYLKKKFPRWDKKAWAPPIIGAITTTITGLATGQVRDIQTGLLYFLFGWASGGSASSIRDMVAGK
jgi:hypothetical protein